MVGSLAICSFTSAHQLCNGACTFAERTFLTTAGRCGGLKVGSNQAQSVEGRGPRTYDRGDRARIAATAWCQQGRASTDHLLPHRMECLALGGVGGATLRLAVLAPRSLAVSRMDGEALELVCDGGGC